MQQVKQQDFLFISKEKYFWVKKEGEMGDEDDGGDEGAKEEEKISLSFPIQTFHAL